MTVKRIAEGRTEGAVTVSAAILAGGQSLRMGRKKKAFLEIGGRSFLEETITRLRPLFEEIIIVGDARAEYASFGVPAYPDLRPGSGSLGGILTALRRSSSPMTFCVACDMPFLNPAVVSRLLQEVPGRWDAVLPRLGEGLEPLCALYAVSLAPRIERLLDSGERRIRLVLEGTRTRFVEEDELRSVDPPLLSFFNVNTPEDLATARRMREEGS